jgi:hypothetical protein
VESGIDTMIKDLSLTEKKALKSLLRETIYAFDQLYKYVIDFVELSE